MKAYVTIADSWRRRVFVPAGTTLVLSETEAKYIKHNLKPYVEPATVDAIAPEASTEDEPPRRRRKVEEAVNGDSI